MDVFKTIRKIRAKLRPRLNDELMVHWFKKGKGSFLEEMFLRDNVISNLPSPPMSKLIEAQALKASQLGELPLWEGFEKLEDYPFPVQKATRNANQVRIDKKMGDFFYHLVCCKKPDVIVEIGTAFGVSGMYWLSGLSNNKKGRLLTFEPNAIWATVALENLSKISSDFSLTVSTFEVEHKKVMNDTNGIDIAFIDAIHQSKIVYNQFDIILQHSKPGTIVLFDDIDFSGDMWKCWKTIAQSHHVKSSCSLSERLGIVELMGSA
jgi:predicted O-methyltransferase YrrM